MILSGIRGVANAFDAPARQSFVVDMVGKEDLSNAIAMNSTMFSIARLIGPAFGTMILVWAGAAWAFTFNGITFLAILGSLLMMHIPPKERRISAQSPIRDLLDGFHFIWQAKPIVGLMIVALAISLFGSNFATLIPVMAKDVYGLDAFGFGMLKLANGAGSFVGAFLITYLSSRPQRGQRLNMLNLVFPITMIAFAFSPTYPLALLTLVAVGVTFIPQLSLCNMLIQSNIPDEIRGRVMSVYTLIIFGANPLGSLISGAMAEEIGAPITIAICGVAVIVISVLTRLFIPKLNALE